MSQHTQEYLKTKVLTASPEMLTLMLWDGAIRFAEQGREAILKKDIEASYHALTRAQRIVMELTTTLKHDVNRELCKNLSSLYTFIYRRLVDANLKREVKPVEDALEIMRHQRETWVLLMNKLSQEKVATATENAAAVTAQIEIPKVEEPVNIMAAANAAAQAAGVAKPKRGYAAFAVRPATAGLSIQG